MCMQIFQVFVVFFDIIFSDYNKLLNSHYASSYRWANAKIPIMMEPENVIYLV